ncbi:hypothetical protein N9N67_02975 [Bacteriovoracaceae bacterium]|nr:hypothetical protein [Bacteriovoracaceae bacterium]
MLRFLITILFSFTLHSQRLMDHQDIKSPEIQKFLQTEKIKKKEIILVIDFTNYYIQLDSQERMRIKDEIWTIKQVNKSQNIPVYSSLKKTIINFKQNDQSIYNTILLADHLIENNYDIDILYKESPDIDLSLDPAFNIIYFSSPFRVLDQKIFHPDIDAIKKIEKETNEDYKNSETDKLRSKICFLNLAEEEHINNQFLSYAENMIKHSGFNYQYLKGSSIFDPKLFKKTISSCDQLWIFFFKGQTSDKTSRSFFRVESHNRKSYFPLDKEIVEIIANFNIIHKKGLAIWAENSLHTNQNLKSKKKKDKLTYKNMPANSLLSKLTGLPEVNIDYNNFERGFLKKIKSRRKRSTLNAINFEIENLNWQGDTISAINRKYKKKFRRDPFYIPLYLSPSDRTIISLAYDNKKDRRWIFDGGFTKFRTTHYASRSLIYVRNIACWLDYQERNKYDCTK